MEIEKLKRLGALRALREEVGRRAQAMREDLVGIAPAIIEPSAIVTNRDVDESEATLVKLRRGCDSLQLLLQELRATSKLTP